MQKQETPEDADSGEFHSRAEQDSKPVRANGKRATPNRKAKVVDPILPEKKRARRRLIGAVALVLAAVIGLPMVLDSEPKPNADDISIQIPSKDKASALAEHTATVQVASAATSTAVSANKNKSLVAEPVEEIIVPPLKVTSDAPLKSVAPSGKTEQKLETPKNEATVDSKPQVPAASKSSAKASSPVATPESLSKAQNKSETADETSRAMAILEGKSAAKPAAKEKATASYIVQVAALATQEKVNELQSALKAANIKSYTQKVITVSGQITRIRVGPFDSKDEAEKMQAKLEKIGLNGKLVPN
ncbi:MAG: SPOR domain-containing protein [Pseudomonadota bacterium]